MTLSPEQFTASVSHKLREWIHEVNNSLFVTKGYLEEIEADIKDRNYQKADFDHENMMDMLQTLMRSVEKMDNSLQKLKKFAREEIFDITGVPRE